MTLNTLFTICSVLSLVFGIAFVLVPGQVHSAYGVMPDGVDRFNGRLMGAAFVGFGVLTWMARGLADTQARRMVVVVMFVTTLLALGVTLLGQIQGVLGPAGWSSVVIYLLEAIGFGYYWFGKRVV